MQNKQSVTFADEGVTSGCNSSVTQTVTQTVTSPVARAHTPLRGRLSSVTVEESRDRERRDKRDVTDGERDSDMTSTGPKGPRSRHHHGAAPSTIAKKPMTWMHVAASNMLEDHAAGLYVDPRKLEAARKLLGR